jgi:hypothetical protein
VESVSYLPLLRVLSAHNIEFILVGGLAAVLQGAPLADSIEMELGDVTIRVLRLERLIQAKEFAGRPKDLAVLPALRATLALSQKR